MHYLPFSLTLLHSSDRFVSLPLSGLSGNDGKKKRISELTPTPLSGGTSSSTGVAKSQSLISNEIESSIKETENLLPEKLSPGISNKLLNFRQTRTKASSNLARPRTAWEVSERTLALTLLNRSKELLFAHPESYRNLADQYLQFGKLILTKDQRSAIAESLKLLNEALELSEKGLAILNEKNQEEALSLTSMKMKTLRFMAAAHLQSEEYANVLKCVRVLKEAAVGTGGEHPSVPFLALKAWLGLGKVVEAEVELKKMVDNSSYPLEVCVSAVEVFF